MKKMTEEQAAKWDRIEKKVSHWFWGIVAIGMIVASAVYGPWVP